MTAGGARAGAGRKKRQTPRVEFTIRMEPEVAERFREICRHTGKSQSKQVESWIRLTRIYDMLNEIEIGVRI